MDFANLRVGWQGAEKLHLTLKFLGDVEDEKISAVIDKVKQAAGQFEKGSLVVTGTGVFPNKRRAKVLWLGVKNRDGLLEKAKDKIEFEFNELGFEKERRTFKPHLTIARLREPNKSKQLAEQHLENDFEPVESSIEALTVYESELKPTGSIYNVLAKIEFI